MSGCEGPKCARDPQARTQLECDSRVTTARCWRSLPLSLKGAVLEPPDTCPEFPTEAAARSPRPSGLPGHAHASAQRGSRAPRGAGPRQGAGTWAHHGGAAWGTKPEAAPARRGPPRSGHSSQRQGQSTARGCVSCHSTRVLACCRPALLAALTAWAGGAGRARGVPTEAVSTEACVFSAQRPAPAHASRPQQGARTAHGLDSQGRSGGSVEGELMFSCSGNHGDRGGGLSAPASR